MIKTSKLGFISVIATLGLALGSTTPANSAEPCTWQTGGPVEVAGCDFTGVDMFNAGLSGANFSNTNLTNLVSRYSYWNSVNFTDANMSNSTFYGAYMASANFNNANLTGANLASTNLDLANFTGATLTGIISGGVTGSPVLPVGWFVSGGYLIGPGANLQGANLSGVDLTGADLSGANLNGVRSGGIIGQPAALPANWGLVGGYLFGPGADLSGAKLDGMQIWGVNLTGANLTGASINQTALNNTTSFVGLRSGGLVGTIQNLNGAKLVDGYIVGAGTSLAGADLRGSDLSNISLEGSDLTGADLTGANLSNSYLVGANLTNTNFTFANLTGTNLSGNLISFSKFNGAQLSGANFSQAVVLASEFYQTNLTDANFFEAVLTSTRSGDIAGTPSNLPLGIQIIDGAITNVFVEGLNPAVSGSYLTGKTLQAAHTEVPNGAIVAYQWLRDGEAIQGANTRTYLVTAKDVNKKLSVKTILSKYSFESKEEISSQVNVAKANIVPGPVSISGTLTAGRTIKAVVRPWVNAVGVKFKYQWYQNGVAIKFATASTYKLRLSDSKKNISVIVLQSLDGYNSASKQSPKKKIS